MAVSKKVHPSSIAFSRTSFPSSNVRFLPMAELRSIAPKPGGKFDIVGVAVVVASSHKSSSIIRGTEAR